MQAILERQFPHSKVTLEKVTVREEEKPSEPEPDQRDEVVDHELPF